MIVCESCGQSMPRRIREYPQDNGGVHQALICLHCQRQYPIAAITLLGVQYRERLSRMRRIQRAMNQLPGPEYHELLARYRQQVTRLTARDIEQQVEAADVSDVATNQTQT